MQGDPKALKFSTADYPASTVQAFAGAIFANPCRGEPVEPVPQASDEVIQHLREALKTCPHEASLALASALLARFTFGTHSTDDCEEAITMLDSHVASTPSGDSADSDSDSEWYRVRATEMIALLVLARSIFYSEPEYSEETISRCRTALSYTSLDGQIRVVLTQALAIHAEQRFRSFGLIDGFREARSLVPEIVNLSSSGEDVGVLYASKRAYPMATVVEKIQDLEEHLTTATSGSLQHRTYLEDLACWYDTKFSRTGDISDLKMAIRHRRMSITLPHSSHPLMFIPLGFLCDDLLIAFDLTRSMEYLEESIVLHRDLLTMQDARALRFTLARRLVLSLCVRFRLLRRRQDVEEIMHLCPMAVHDTNANVTDRFKFSCLWASLARHFRHVSVSNAYESAMSLMQPSLVFAPVIHVQQAQLVEMAESCRSMPMDYVSHRIEAGCLEEAIEALERGRALLWSQLRSFRTSMDQPISSHLLLAEKFATVNHKLEGLTLSATLDLDDSEAGGREGRQMDPFCRLVTKQRKLLKERDTLVSHIRGLPGFEDFLKPPSFQTLRSVASRGPVIIVNHSKWRSDILILLRDAPPSLIPTPNDFYDRANRLRDRLFDERRRFSSSDPVGFSDYASVVRSVLAGLYALVGRLVIEQLRALGVPEQSRVWWCPTSVFCFLPLHAMGPIPSGNHVGRYFCDIYIPSYTSTLSALLGARKPVSQKSKSDRPSLLLVAHHDQKPKGLRKEIGVVKWLRRPRVKTLKGKGATAAAVVEGLQRHPFVHIAGSYKLESGRPLEARLELYRGERLTLLDIVRRCPAAGPGAEFAFLSASHTAELIDENIPDEALHLASAMQHCGFRSVVGTMWGMADEDGKVVCERFYKRMFAKDGKGEGGEEAPCYERAAGALRDAVQKLRKKKGVSVDRWVTYVHYGA